MIKGILFSLLFLVIYLEPVYFGPIKFSLLWKALFFCVLFFLAFTRFRITKLNLYAYLYCFKHIFSIGALKSFGESFMEVFKTSTIPFALHAAQSCYDKNPDKVRNFVSQALSFLAFSFVLINLPFLLGIIPELSKGIALTALGGELHGYSGPFQNGHAASITVGASSIVLLFEIFNAKSKLQKIIAFIVFILSLVVIYKTLVRTGFLMVGVGVIVFTYSLYGIKVILKYLPLIGLGCLLLVSAVASNEELMMRLFDGSVYENNHSHWFYTVGSGRLWMAWTNVAFWLDSGLQSWLFGTGIGPSKDNMELVVGIRVFSHNGFIDALSHNGLIGLFLYVMVLVHSYRTIKRNVYKCKLTSSLAISVFISYLIFAFFQGGSRFYFDIIYVLVLLNLNYMKKSAL